MEYAADGQQLLDENTKQALTTRCKFRCDSVTILSPNSSGKNPRNVVLIPVSSSDPKSENKKFWDFTPSGKLEFQWINDQVNFEPGKEYYVDISEAKGK